MDQRLDKLEGVGKHIWLRYATQFTANGRTYTLEMSVPMPIGANAELREQLLTEADAGMNQLASHVEHRAAQILQQVQPSQEAIPVPTPIAQPAVTSQRPIKPTPTPATTSLPQTVAQEVAQPVASIPSVRETPPEPVAKEVSVPVTRTTVGASMPAATMMGATGGNLTIPEFVKLIRESMGLDPKQAMEMLKVKSLNGLNLRDALERLQRIHAQSSAAENRASVGDDVFRPANVAGARTDDTVGGGDRTGGRETVLPPLPITPSARPAPVSGPPSKSATVSGNNVARTTGNAPGREQASMMGAVYEEPTVRIFDEEINPEEEGEVSEELADLDESRELTIPERVRARTLISRLRESRGATTVNAARLQVLDNVIGEQISKEALHELVASLWEVQVLKKLKVDQVEALISWAKEDDFVNEVEAVLILLEEENYARGNR
ncbi:MAG TPA: hypothetical protein VFA10_23585 [Ktedonobacteraceae bacterium]|jgi:hypothetical protein|nr:hypothetical protein [Ktedonobacteraceae bacterium]